LTTSYAALQKMIAMPKVSSDPKKGFVVKKDDAQKVAIFVKVRKENDKPVIRVEDQVTTPETLVAALSKYVKETRKTQMLLDEKDVDWGTVVTILDAAK